MKKICQFNFLLVLLVLLSPGSLKATVLFPNLPPSSTYYVDLAHVITLEDGKEIDRMAEQLWQNEKVPLLVVTISSLAEQGAGNLSIEFYSKELFNHWKIGSQENNCGLLLLLSVHDRRVRLTFGDGWSDSQVLEKSRVVDQILPDFKHGDYSRGLVTGVRVLNGALSSEYSTLKTAFFSVGGALVAILFLCVIFYLVKMLLSVAPGQQYNRYRPWLYGRSNSSHHHHTKCSSSRVGGGFSSGRGSTGSF